MPGRPVGWYCTNPIVLQPDARTIGERHAVARLHRGVRREGEDLAHAAGTEDDGPAEHRVHLSAADVECGNAADAPAVREESRGEVLVVADDRIVAHGVLKERMQHVEAGLVGREPDAAHTHAAEGAHGDPTVRRAAPWAAPVLELDELPRSRLDEGLDRVLIREEVAALHRVVGVEIEAVVRPHRARGTALDGHRVAAHGIELRDHRDGEFRSALCYGDRRAQTGRSPADQYNVVLLNLHLNSCPLIAVPWQLDSTRFSIRVCRACDTQFRVTVGWTKRCKPLPSACRPGGAVRTKAAERALSGACAIRC